MLRAVISTALFRWTKKPRSSKLRALRRIVAASQPDGRRRCSGNSPGRSAASTAGPRRSLASWRDAQSVDIIAAYFAPPGSLLRPFRPHRARAGKVRIITAAKSDNNATIAAARHTYSRLLRRRVQMYEYEPAKLHTKLGDRRRYRPHRLFEPRFPQPLHQPGDHAADRRCRLRRADAPLFRARAEPTASRSRSRCIASAPPFYADSSGRFRTGW